MAIELDISRLDDVGELFAHLVSGRLENRFGERQRYVRFNPWDIHTKACIFIAKLTQTKFSLPLSRWAVASLSPAADTYGGALEDIIYSQVSPKLSSLRSLLGNVSSLSYKPELSCEPKIDKDGNLVHLKFGGNYTCAVHSDDYEWAGGNPDGDFSWAGLLNSANWKSRRG